MMKFEVTTKENKYIVVVNKVNDKYDDCTTTNFSYLVNILTDYVCETGEIKVNNYNVEGVFESLEEVKVAVNKFIEMMETKWKLVK